MLTHIAQQNQVYKRGLLEKDHPEAQVLMTDFLESTPPKPDEVADGDDDAMRKKKRWYKAHWERGMKDTQNLMNQCLPNSFIAGPLTVYLPWNHVRYGRHSKGATG